MARACNRLEVSHVRPIMAPELVTQWSGRSGWGFEKKNRKEEDWIQLKSKVNREKMNN